MNEITIPYHLLIAIVLTLIGLGSAFYYRKKRFATNNLLWISTTVFLLLYLMIVGTAAYYTVFYQWDLKRFDLDKNGFFNGIEITAEQRESMRKVTNDTGRNLSFLSGLVLAFIVASTVYILGKFISKWRH